MKVFSIEVMVCATAYIRAATEEEAFAKAQTMAGMGFDMDDGTEIGFSGLPYDHAELPDMSLSPAMTITELTTDKAAGMTCVHDPDDVTSN